MISSPSPAQPPAQETREPKPIKSTPLRQRPGQSPTARFFKAIFRPILKLFYYIITGMRKHKLFSLLVIILLLASISVTNFLATGLWPFSIGNDQFNFNIRGGSGGGEAVKNWLYALRSGDKTALQLLDGDMSQPPDVTSLISSYSQTSSRTWKSITVIKAYSQPDMVVDSFVNVEYSASGPGGKTNGVAIWHFITVTQGRDYLLQAEIIGFRRM